MTTDGEGTSYSGSETSQSKLRNPIEHELGDIICYKLLIESFYNNDLGNFELIDMIIHLQNR